MRAHWHEGLARRVLDLFVVAAAAAAPLASQELPRHQHLLLGGHLTMSQLKFLDEYGEGLEVDSQGLEEAWLVAVEGQGWGQSDFPSVVAAAAFVSVADSVVVP